MALRLSVQKAWHRLAQAFARPGLGASRKKQPLGLLMRGAPKGIRTPDLPLRRRSLYPAELWVHMRLSPVYYGTNPPDCQEKKWDNPSKPWRGRDDPLEARKQMSYNVPSS